MRCSRYVLERKMTRRFRQIVLIDLLYTSTDSSLILGISVSNTPGAVDASTATIAIWLMLGALRQIHIPYMATRSGNWRGRMTLTHDPENKILGILGMGGIGTAVAKRAVAFGMSLQYHNRHELSEEKNTIGAKYVGFEELLRTSDVISVHLPLNEGTRGMLGKKEFEMMKDGVVLVNTARGPIVDEATLVEALESGKVWGAGLDVYEREPIIHEGLLKNDHCVLMPHVGTAALETQRKMEELVIRNLRSAITEGKLLTPVAESKAVVSNEVNGVEKVEKKYGKSVCGATTILESSDSKIETATPTPGPANNIPNGTISPTPTTPQQPLNHLTTASSTSTLGSPAIPIIDAVNPEDPSPPSSYPTSNTDSKPTPDYKPIPETKSLTPSTAAIPPPLNISNNDNTTKGSNGLWTTPTSPSAAAKKEYNWLELSPPLKPKEKDVADVLPPLVGHVGRVNGVGDAEGTANAEAVNGVEQVGEV